MSTIPPSAHPTDPVRVPISKRLVLINSASSVVTRLLTVGVFAWAIQYLMKRIPEEELAILPIVMSIAMLLPVLQTILVGGLSRYVTDAYARNDLDGVTRIVSSQFPLLLGGSLLIFLIGGGVAWNFERVLTIPPAMVGPARFMVLLVVGRLTIAIALAPFNTGLFAKQRFVLKNGIDIASSLLRIVLMLVLILGVGPRVEWVIVAQVASQLFGQITSTVVSMRLLPALRFHPGKFDWDTSKKVLSFGGWSFVSEAAYLIRRAADAPILNELATPLAVNNFFLGSLFETQLRQLAVTASEPLLPALTAMHAHQQKSRLAAAFLRGGRIVLWAAMFMAVPMIVFAYELFELYLGQAYREHVDAATVMIILLLTFPLTYPMLVFVRICYARGNIRAIAVSTLIAQLGNLALTLLLVGKFGLGAIGSAAATFVTFAILYPFYIWPMAIRTLEVTWRRFLTQTLLPGLLPAVVAACVGLIAAQFFASSFAVVSVGIPVCLASYAITVWFLLKPADRADLARIRQLVSI